MRVKISTSQSHSTTTAAVLDGAEQREPLLSSHMADGPDDEEVCSCIECVGMPLTLGLTHCPNLSRDYLKNESSIVYCLFLHANHKINASGKFLIHSQGS